MKTNFRFLIAAIAVLSFICSNKNFGQNREYLITSFGAVADGITNNARSIQNAIDQASNDGGGIVIIPPGNFATGVIFLKSNVDLHLQLGARLLGSVKRNDYNNPIVPALIAAEDQKNISISGEGVIDGQAQELMKDIFLMLQNGTLNDPQWKFKRPTEVSRPKLIDFSNCENIRLTGVTLKNSANWVQNFNKCKNAIIDNIKVESTAYWNNDGIDITDCKNVKITNCFVNSSDDGICLKSEDPDDFCDGIFVSDCTIRSSASAFKLGTASRGGFKNIKARNLTIYDTYRSAVALESVDGGFLENIDIENIDAKNTGNAIFIRLGKRNEKKTSVIKNVRIAGLKAEIPLRKPDLGYPLEGPPDYLRYRYVQSAKERPDLGYPFIGQPDYPYNLIPSSIVGLPGNNIENITLKNIEINFEGAGNKNVAYIDLDSLQKVPEKSAEYPEFSMFGELPAWGFYIRHVSGIKMQNVKLCYKKFDFRPAIIFDDVQNINLDEVKIPTGKELPIILFNNSVKKTIKNVELPVGISDGILEQNTK